MIKIIMLLFCVNILITSCIPEKENVSGEKEKSTVDLNTLESAISTQTDTFSDTHTNTNTNTEILVSADWYREINNPMPVLNGKFGNRSFILNNNNILLSNNRVISGDLGDVGSYHLYNASGDEVIASFGEVDSSELWGHLYILENSNFIIKTTNSFLLIDGFSGSVIKNWAVSDNEEIKVGQDSFMLYTYRAETIDIYGEGEIEGTRFYDGVTGEPIGSYIPETNEQVDIKYLNNGNILFRWDDVVDGYLSDIAFYNGVTFEHIATLNDLGNLWRLYDIDELSNGDLILIGRGGEDIVSGLTNLRLIDADTGEIKIEFFKDIAEKQYTDYRIEELSNGKFIIMYEVKVNFSTSYQIDILTAQGQILSSHTLDGYFSRIREISEDYFTMNQLVIDSASGQLVYELEEGELAGNSLPNKNLILESANYSSDGIENRGRIRVFNPETGRFIGSTYYGVNQDDRLGHGATLSFENNNYLVVNRYVDHNGKVDVGSAILFDGELGTEVISIIYGVNSDEWSATYSNIYNTQEWSLEVNILDNETFLL